MEQLERRISRLCINVFRKRIQRDVSRTARGAVEVEEEERRKVSEKGRRT